MHLVVFKVSSDGDYGATSFENEGQEGKLEDLYGQMKETAADVIYSEDWTLELMEEIPVADMHDANRLLKVMNITTEIIGSSIITDHINWYYLIKEV